VGKLSFNGHANNGPCKGCTERYEACHGKCERYLEWKKKNEKVNDARQAYGRTFDTISESRKRKIWKKKRYGNR
jgi:hypothetical protein